MEIIEEENIEDEEIGDEKKHKHEIDMTDGSVLKKMLLFSFPLMGSSILQLLFNAADIIVIGRFAGDNSLAAVGATSSLINLLVNLFVGLAIGANVLTARYYGAKRDADISQAVHTSIALSIVCGAGLAVIGILISKPVLAMMATPDEILPLSTIYMQIYFAGMPAMMIYNFGSAVLRAKGDTARPLVYLAVAGVLNVGLNLFFVISLHMDVEGVAAATSISQCLSAFLVLRCLSKEPDAFRLKAKLLRINRQKLKVILQIGLPAGFQGVLFALSNVIIQSSINSFGKYVMAGSAASSNLENFTYFAMNAFYQAAISFTSQNVGAGKYKRVKKILICAVTCAAVTGITLGNLTYLFGSPLLGIYSKSAPVIREGLKRMLFICVPYFICGIMDTMTGMIRGLGYSILPMIVSLLGACVLRIIWILTVCRLPAFHHVEFVYASYPVTWAITTAAHIICYVIITKKIKKSIESQQKMG